MTAKPAAAQALLVLVSAPADVAERLATTLVEARLAACVSVLPGLRSTYRWAGRVERAEEALLLVKSTEAAFPALQAAVLAGHPYELPELLAVDVAAGLPAYLHWLTESVAPPA